MSFDPTTLAEWLAGEFDNQRQAQEQPVWFVPLRLWHRPLPFRIDGNLALFCEQANTLNLDSPYRQRVVILQALPNSLIGKATYRAFKHPDRFQGAGANPDLLTTLTGDDLDELPGCELTIVLLADRVKAEPESDVKCYFQYNGQTRQVILGFEATADRFWSFDRGVEPETGKLLWGAMMGPYEFQKRQSFAADLPR